jgi:hypothetical protein
MKEKGKDGTGDGRGKEGGKERRNGKQKNFFGGSRFECDIFLQINLQSRVTGQFSKPITRRTYVVCVCVCVCVCV